MTTKQDFPEATVEEKIAFRKWWDSQVPPEQDSVMSKILASTQGRNGLQPPQETKLRK